MKTSIYIDQSSTQFVFTPENDFEAGMVNEIVKGGVVRVITGSFYECRGGFVREGKTDDSLIIRITPEPKPEQP